MKRRAIISLILFCCSLFISVTYAKSDKTLSLGWEDWKPFQYKDKSGNLAGLDVELLSAILNEMNCSLTFINIPWSRHLIELQEGKIDLAASASKNAERQVYAYFSNGYREEKMSLFVKTDKLSTYNFSSLKDIISTKFTLGVDKGYYYGEEYEALTNQPPFKSHIQEVNGVSTNVKKLSGGRIDGFLNESIAINDYLKEQGIKGEISQHPMNIHTDAVHIMFSKASTSQALVDKFNESLKKLQDSGKLMEILNKYS